MRDVLTTRFSVRRFCMDYIAGGVAAARRPIHANSLKVGIGVPFLPFHKPLSFVFKKPLVLFIRGSNRNVLNIAG